MTQDLTRRFYVKNVGDWQKQLAANKFSAREISVKVIERGIVLPAQKIPNTLTYKGGVCDKDFNFVAGFLRTSGNKKIHRGGGFVTQLTPSTGRNSFSLRRT